MSYSWEGKDTFAGTVPVEVKENITLDPYIVGKSSTITGHYNGTNGAFLRGEVNGEKKGLVSSKDLAQGKINYYVGKDLKAGDNVEVGIFDKNYQEIGRQKVVISVEQVFDIKGSVVTGGSSNKLLITVKDHKINIKDNFFFGYVAPMELSWKGNDLVSTNDWGTYDIPEGSTVVMYHAEGTSQRFSTNDDAELKSKAGHTYTYMMEDNRLVLKNVE